MANLPVCCLEISQRGHWENLFSRRQKPMSETQCSGCVQGWVATEGQRWDWGHEAHLRSFLASNGFVLYVPPHSSWSRRNPGASDTANSGGGTGTATTAGQGARRKWKHSLQMSSTVMFLFIKMQGFLNLILNRTIEKPMCYSSLPFLLILLFWEAH